MTTVQTFSSSIPPVHRCFGRSQSSKLASTTFFSSRKFSKRLRTSTIRGINSNDPKESVFLDENGVVEDMDSYLNYLSLEYDSVWDTKPSWCQPWTITLTGTVIISLSWLILHSAVATAVVMTIIGAWWYIFLYSYPKGFTFVRDIIGIGYMLQRLIRIATEKEKRSEILNAPTMRGEDQ